MPRQRYLGTEEQRQEHVKALMRGLDHMPDYFLADMCWGCAGTTRRRQMFTHGCGGGYYHSMDDCDICGGEGLLMGSRPVPTSVTEQVLVAGRNSVLVVEEEEMNRLSGPYLGGFDD